MRQIVGIVLLCLKLVVSRVAIQAMKRPTKGERGLFGVLSSL
jgi:hypothetical protein